MFLKKHGDFIKASSHKQTGVDSTSWLPGDRDVTGQIEVPQSLDAGTYRLGLALVDLRT